MGNEFSCLSGDCYLESTGPTCAAFGTCKKCGIEFQGRDQCKPECCPAQKYCNLDDRGCDFESMRLICADFGIEFISSHSPPLYASRNININAMKSTRLLGYAILLLATLPISEGSIECDKTSTCEDALRPGSVCVDGYCSNPFQHGCLRTFLGEEVFPHKRVCNSDDPTDAAERGLCDAPPFEEYEEVRILNQNWGSPMYSSWIMQMLLSELLGVPTTIETSDPDLHYNFYDPKRRADHGAETYPYQSLRKAHEVRDCREVKLDGGFVSCAHVMPMVNKVGQANVIEKLKDDGIIAQPRDSGTNAQYRWWMPMHHAEQNPELLSYFGMRKEPARSKIAELFKRPTSWETYCSLISPNNCSTRDDVAERAPADEDEEGKYFAGGLYTGYFRATEKNDCASNPTGCTGHIANVPCEWGNYALAQAYHLGIPVSSDGSLEPNGGYAYDSLLEIYAAANATGSNVLMYWWEPDTLIESYRGTDYELVSIALPLPTKECVANRVSKDQRCSTNFTEQVGSPEGACDAGPVPNAMLMTLGECEIQDWSCSPAFSALQSYELTNLDLQQIYQFSFEAPSNDRREAACRWFSENLDAIRETFIPRTYPRKPRNEGFYGAYFPMAVSILAMVCVLLCAFGTKHYKKTKVMIYAQVDFLLIILSGLFLVALSALLFSMSPTKELCASRQWFVMVGYSLELIPLTVKVAAINKLFRGGSRMRRVQVKRRSLYQIVGGCILLVCVFLAIWTRADPPIPRTFLILTNDIENDNYIEDVTSSCISSNGVWQIVSNVYLLCLILIAAAIATQNRGIREEFNETRYLVIMLYSHLTFIGLRVVFSFWKDINVANLFSETTVVSAGLSLLLSMDCLITLGIYFLPKLIAARRANGEATEPRSFYWHMGWHHYLISYAPK